MITKLPYLNGLVCRPLNRPTSNVPEKLENRHLDSSPAPFLSHAPFTEENFIEYQVDGLPVSTLGFDLLQKPASFSNHGAPISQEWREEVKTNYLWRVYQVLLVSPKKTSIFSTQVGFMN